MNDLFTKLKILVLHLCSAFGEWRECVWQRNLDDYHCCNGGTGSHDVCGCGGATIREVWGRDD